MKRAICVAAILAVVSVSLQSAVAADTNDGKEIFETNCLVCHGKNGILTETGKGLGASDLRSAKVQSLTPAKMKEVVMQGKGKMPSFAGLSDDDIDAVVRYIRTFKAKAHNTSSKSEK